MKIKVGQSVPKGYRICWLRSRTRQYICFPICIHWFMKHAFRLWAWSRRYFPTDLEIRERAAYQRGLEDGKKHTKFDDLSADVQEYTEENL